MSVHAWHLGGVVVPYVLIATALWGLSSGAVKDAVRVGSLPARTPLRLGRLRLAVPTVPLAYVFGFGAVAFIYGCALDRNHLGVMIGADPHAVAPGADAFLYGLAAASWLSASLLLGPYRWLRRRTRELLAAPVARDAAEARYRLLAVHLTDLVAHHHPDGRYEWVSASSEALLGYRPEELVGRDPYDLFHPEDVERIRTESHDLLLDGRQRSTLIRYRIRHRDGHYLWFESLTETLRDEGDQLVGLQVMSRDVTERQAIEDELRRRAHHDAMTGLANRALFTLRLDALVERARTGDGAFAVLYLDLDRFKVINDTMGHSVGDDLLVQFADRIRQTTRWRDTVARIGGDEFAVLLEGVGSEAAAVEAAARIERALRVPFDLAGTQRTVAVSIGVALGRPDHTGSGDVLREADLATYEAKGRAEGGPAWAVFSPALREARDRRLRLEADLDRAVDRDELRVAYQPIVSLDTGRIHGVEALLRWAHPELGLLAPDTFISIAEETGRIADLDHWVMAEGLAQVGRWEASLGRSLDLTLAVNCSAYDLQDPQFADRVRTLLDADRSRQLVVEITESLLVDDPQRVADVMTSLSEHGVRFAMDDFGTGYSSLSVIHTLPVHKVKVDRAFVQRMHEDQAAFGMVQTVLGFAQTLGARVVAEGIETPEQWADLRDLGCDYGQGYHFARPLSADAMEGLLRDGAPWVIGTAADSA